MLDLYIIFVDFSFKNLTDSSWVDTISKKTDF